MPPESAPLWPLYAQAIAFSLVMGAVHCPGMCGPLMLAFRFGQGPTSAASATRHIGRAALQVAAYQSGRACLYVLFGLVVGGLGQSLDGLIGNVGPWLVLAVAAGFLLAVCWRVQLAAWWPRSPRNDAQHPDLVTRMSTQLARRFRQRPVLRAASLGAIMAFLPCHVPFVVMGLAAASASVIHGPLLMLIVVLASTPALVVMAGLTGVVGPRRLQRAEAWLAPTAMTIAAAWLTLLGLARLGLIPHLAIPLPAAWAIPLPGGGALDHIPLF